MKIRFITSAALALCCSAIYADDTSSKDACAKPKCAKTCSNMKRPDIALCNVPPAYNIPARITSCGGSTFEVDASYLYWCIVQDYMDIGRTAELAALDTTSPADTTEVASIPNQYESGFRVGIGSGTTFDDWQLHLGYTYLHRTKAYTIGNVSTVSTIPIGGTVYQQNEWFDGTLDAAIGGFVSTWKMNFDSLDLSLGRPFYQGKNLTITPYTGLFGVYLRQNLNIDAFRTDEGIDVSSNNSHAWGVGPEVGSNFHWLLGSGFRIEADAEFSLMYMSYSKQTHSQDLDDVASAGFIPDAAYLRPYFDLSLGLGYGTYFMDNYHFDLFAGYEFVSLAQQNVMRKNVGLLGGFAHSEGDLNFHGLTVSARFDF